MKTQQFYTKNAASYIEDSMSFDMTKFYKILDTFIDRLNHPSHTLDIGFGSAREMLYLEFKSHNVIGIDSCPEFIQNARDQKLTVYPGVLPDMTSLPYHIKYDLVYSVGLIFHLNKEDRIQLFENTIKRMKPGAVLVLSYNTLDRSSDTDREFFTLDQDEVNAEVGLLVIKEEVMKDSKRDFDWITVAYMKGC